MDAWDGWELGRAVLALSALLFAGIWVQLSLLHWRAAFRRWEMYGPVFATPLIVVGVLLGVLDREGPLGWIALVALGIGTAEGLAGVFFHVRGIAYQVGGVLSVRNLMAGPPPVLPLAYAIVGVLGLMGMLWDA